jgi:hypothetical protein
MAEITASTAETFGAEHVVDARCIRGRALHRSLRQQRDRRKRMNVPIDIHPVPEECRCECAHDGAHNVTLHMIFWCARTRDVQGFIMSAFTMPGFTSSIAGLGALLKTLRSALQQVDYKLLLRTIIA